MLERIKHNPDLADYLYTCGPERILHDTCTYLEKATQQGLIVCDQPMASAKVFLGCLWNFKWKMMTGVSINETAKELDEYVEYCVNLFLKAHEYKQNF